MSNNNGNSHKLIVVVGATGQQGGATAKHLIAKGFRVRALTRDEGKSQAQDLAAKGAEVKQADLDDRAALDEAFAGAHGVFSVQTPFAPGGTVGETKQGVNVADAAKAAGVKHVVYTSVGGAERETGIPHFESKWAVEEHARAIGLPVTILRPVFFMENFNFFARPQLQNGTYVLTMAMQPGKPLQLIAVDDIGFFAAEAFEHPEQYIGEAIELAGDSLTLPQIAEHMQSQTGKQVAFYPLTIEQVRGFGGEDMALMFEWFNSSGYGADIAALRKIHPGLMDFKTWLKRTDWTI